MTKEEIHELFDTCKARMNEAGDYCNHEFDYQEDFAQILEEARKNASKGTLNTTQDDPSVKEQCNGKQKCRKSWRDSLFTWLKAVRKSKSSKRSMNGTAFAKTRGRHVSGPVQGNSCRNAAGRVLRAASGPLTCIFSSTKGEDEYEVPYTCLAHVNNTRNQIHPYGPIYLVT